MHLLARWPPSDPMWSNRKRQKRELPSYGLFPLPSLSWMYTERRVGQERFSNYRRKTGVFVPVLKPLILYKGQQHDRRHTRAKNGSLLGRRNMHSMHERRKGVSSAAVIWYRVLFRQNRTDRPNGTASQTLIRLGVQAPTSL